MKKDDERHVDEFLEIFDELSKKLNKAKHLFKSGQIKESYETLWSVSYRAERLGDNLSWYRCRTPNGRSLTMATAQEVAQFEQLNLFFVDLQNKTRTKITEIKSAMDKKLSDGDFFMNDYEIDVKVCCTFGKNDPLSLDDDDNFMCTFRHPIFHVSHEDNSQTNNYNDMAHWPEHPLHGQKHCHFFHEILDHVYPALSLDDVLRIGEVWIDVKVYHQCFQKYRT